MIGRDFVRCDWCGKYQHSMVGPWPRDWFTQGEKYDFRIFCCKEHQDAFNKRYSKKESEAE